MEAVNLAWEEPARSAGLKKSSLRLLVKMFARFLLLFSGMETHQETGLFMMFS